MICNPNNQKSHDLVQDALQILDNLTHRGACGCDETNGDGAGILIQKPHVFLTKAAEKEGIQLPGESDYAAGLVFLPSDETCCNTTRQIMEDAARSKGLIFLGWREVPINPEAARCVDRFLMGKTDLPEKPCCDLPRV